MGRHQVSWIALSPAMRLSNLCLAVLVLASSAAPLEAQQNPYDRELRRLSSEVRRSGRTPRGVVPLLELQGLRRDASPGLVQRELGRLATERRLSAPLRVLASTEQAYGMLGDGRYSEAVAQLERLGFLTSFRIIGGFDDEGKQGFAREYAPETGRNAPVASDDDSFPGKVRPLHWRDYPEDLGRFGFVDFDATLRPYQNACAYAETFVHVDRARPMSLWAGVGGAYKVWVNGEEVMSDDVYRMPAIERSAAVFSAREGHNRILVKVCVQDRRWGFYLRLGEADGSPPEGYDVDARGATEASAAGAPVRLPTAPNAPLAFLSARVEADEDDVAAHFDLARYLAWTGADDPADRKSRQLAERAAELRPNAEHLLYAAELAESRAERMRFVAQAEERAPRDAEVRLARIRLIATGPDSGRALRMLESIPMTTTTGLEAAWLRTSLLEQHNLRQAAGALIRQAAARTGNAIRWRYRLAAALSVVGEIEASWAVKREVLENVQDDSQLRMEFMDDAYERGASDELFAHLDQLRALDPADPRTLQYAASVYEGLGRHDEALAIYHQIIAYAPDEAAHHARLGRALLRIGQERLAIESFRQVLALRPQDAATRQLMDRLQPRERVDEAWATSTEEILSRRSDSNEWHSTMLHNLQVATVFETGLSSNFHQVAYQVHDEEGARGMSRFPITYEPGQQWVEVRSAKVHRADGTIVDANNTSEQSLGDSRYRIYYDTRALVINLPQLQPGDTVEIRYRVEDVSRRNMFNNYYGNIRYLQQASPTRRLEHVLITPRSREFYFNEPTLRGLERTVEQRGENNVHRFVATDVPALRTESHMPGPAETRPYLHVSTYRSWEDVGRWWWGLVQDQLIPDDSLRRTTLELVAGAANDREKVTRIYDWVIRNTRYVGLEFGIHGFKPYRVTQIVRRGFGDCKDKASLIYAMLTIAGVDARIALIRTRRNGAINPAPASLAIFDHAIAYVPQFDLFLDGTAEMNGTTELPAMDQGTVTLLVGPESAELRATPVLPASRNVRTRELNVTLALDGSAEVRGDEQIQGTSASSYRSQYEAAGLQAERLQRELAQGFSGIELSSHRFENLDAYESSPRVHWEGRVPQFAERSGANLLVAPASMGNLTRAYTPAPTRRHTLELGPPRRHVESRSIRIPRGATVSALPSGGEARSEFGSLTISYTRQGQNIIVRCVFELATHRVSAEDYPAFRRFIQEADVLLRERISFGGAQ
ncbi:MAG: DUF3857 domain-containing protein [Polyangiales bacterium]